MEPDPSTICFGLSERLDRSSCELFLRLLGRQEVAARVASRLSTAEITALIDHLSELLRRHLSKDEYHRLFLQNSAHTEQDLPGSADET